MYNIIYKTIKAFIVIFFIIILTYICFKADENIPSISSSSSKQLSLSRSSPTSFAPRIKGKAGNSSRYKKYIEDHLWSRRGEIQQKTPFKNEGINDQSSSTLPTFSREANSKGKTSFLEKKFSTQREIPDLEDNVKIKPMPYFHSSLKPHYEHASLEQISKAVNKTQQPIDASPTSAPPVSSSTSSTSTSASIASPSPPLVTISSSSTSTSASTASPSPPLVTISSSPTSTPIHTGAIPMLTLAAGNPSPPSTVQYPVPVPTLNPPFVVTVVPMPNPIPSLPINPTGAISTQGLSTKNLLPVLPLSTVTNPVFNVIPTTTTQPGTSRALSSDVMVSPTETIHTPSIPVISSRSESIQLPIQNTPAIITNTSQTVASLATIPVISPGVNSQPAPQAVNKSTILNEEKFPPQGQKEKKITIEDLAARLGTIGSQIKQLKQIIAKEKLKKIKQRKDVDDLVISQPEIKGMDEGETKPKEVERDFPEHLRKMAEKIIDLKNYKKVINNSKNRKLYEGFIVVFEGIEQDYTKLNPNYKNGQLLDCIKEFKAEKEIKRNKNSKNKEANQKKKQKEEEKIKNRKDKKHIKKAKKVTNKAPSEKTLENILKND